MGLNLTVRRAGSAAVLAALLLAATGCGGGSEAPKAATASTDFPTVSTASASARAAHRQAEALKIERAEARTAALREKVAALKATKKAQREVHDAAAGGGSASGGGSSAASAGQKQSFDQLAASISGQIGLAYVNRNGEVVTLGPWQSGSAWSTSKVPVAVALSRQTGGATDAMRRAITASDNASAEEMWASLGTPAQAGQKVQAVLADAGDTSTHVQTEVVRSGFTSFGQTDWSLANSARLAGALPCLAGARPVLDLMGQVESDQQWGIGAAAPGSRFKGGWGPQSSGGYLVRQLGLMRLSGGGQTPLAIAALPSDGSFDTGTSQLTQIAQWAAKNLPAAGSTC